MSKKIAEYDPETEKMIEGVGPEAPVHRHKSGGLESKPIGLFIQSFPAEGVIEVGKIVQHGAERYAPNNWRLIPRSSHFNHAVAHILAGIAGDTQDDHWAHAACRLLMGLSVPDDGPYHKPEAGCAKCATEWPEPQHDGNCNKGKCPIGRIIAAKCPQCGSENIWQYPDPTDNNVFCADCFLVMSQPEALATWNAYATEIGQSDRNEEAEGENGS